MFEDDIEKLRLEKANLINTRDNKEDQQVDTQVAINYTNYFMEHLDDLLMGSSDPHQNAAMFGLLFEETPTYQQLIDGTPKLACLFKLNDDYKTTKSIDVNRLRLESNTFDAYFNRVYQAFQQYQIQVPAYS